MKKQHLAYLTIAAVAAATSIIAANYWTPQEKPVKRADLWIDRKAPPPTLQGLWEDMDSVALVRIVDHRTEERQVVLGDRLTPQPESAYEATVLEVLKAGSQVLKEGQTITVVRPGGSVDEGSYIVKRVEPEFPEWEIGADYILFLRWDTTRAAFSVTYGPSASFAVRDGKVGTNGRSALARSLSGQPAEGLLAALRQIQRSAKEKKE